MRRILLIWLIMVLFPKMASSQSCENDQIVTDQAGRTLVAHGPLRKRLVGKEEGYFIERLGWIVGKGDRFAQLLKEHPTDTYDVWLLSDEDDTERYKEPLAMTGMLLTFQGREKSGWKVDEAYELSPKRGLLISLDSCLTDFLELQRGKLVTITFRPEFVP